MIRNIKPAKKRAAMDNDNAIEERRGEREREKTRPPEVLSLYRLPVVGSRTGGAINDINATRGKHGPISSRGLRNNKQ